MKASKSLTSELQMFLFSKTLGYMASGQLPFSGLLLLLLSRFSHVQLCETP